MVGGQLDHHQIFRWKKLSQVEIEDIGIWVFQKKINDRRWQKVVSEQPFTSLSESKFTAISKVLSQKRIDHVISNEL